MTEHEEAVKQIAKIIITDAKAMKFGGEGGWITSASAELCAREILDYLNQRKPNDHSA
jgi:hypothetical protein